MTDAARHAVPPPGSDLALAAGCACPVLDNRHGAGCYIDGNGRPLYVVNSECLLHGVSGFLVDDGDVKLDSNG